MNYQTKRNIAAGGATFTILWALSLSHMFNDMLQSLVSAIYPLIKDPLHLSYAQIGLITLTFQFSSSVFQPVVGWITDKRPQPWSLPIGMSITMTGLLLLSQASSLLVVLISVALIGFGSAIFHPESSRLAHMASGGRHGMAQSLFQVGGNLGGSLGPLLAALIVAPYGQQNVKWFSLVALMAIAVMIPVSRWYKSNLKRMKRKKRIVVLPPSPLSRPKTILSLGILLVLIFSKYVYMASINSYYTFYLMHQFDVTVREAQIYLFVFLFSVAAGTLIGGPVGDRIGRKYVIWASILGVAPFTLLMPYANLMWTCILSVFIGLILSSAFSAILVYAQELMPGKVGTIAGLFFGLAFGIAGIASAVWGKVADQQGIEYVYRICSYLPLLGIVTWFLPDIRKNKLHAVQH
ncbi:MAG: MFS transporter [Bacteroidales bacterium]|jgi:FSR family fosmidomycin resistance protein-like MFS transporter|nr:MFS transporter [Bacteroidales bacterium]